MQSALASALVSIPLDDAHVQPSFGAYQSVAWAAGLPLGGDARVSPWRPTEEDSSHPSNHAFNSTTFNSVDGSAAVGLGESGVSLQNPSTGSAAPYRPTRPPQVEGRLTYVHPHDSALHVGPLLPAFLNDPPEQHVDLHFHAHAYKLLSDLPRAPVNGEVAILRCYANGMKKAVIERDTDLLTPSEIKQNEKAVVQAMYDELCLWHRYGCFSRKPRAQARNIIDTRWVLKWKWVNRDGKQVRVIRARLTVRGFKDIDAQDMSAFAGTASRWAQRIVVSEAIARGWPLLSVDVAKAFLQGVAYEELAEMTGQPQREVNFVLPPSSVEVLRRIPEFSSFDSAKEVLHCDKPGTGLRDAPRAFSMKLRKVTQSCNFHSSVVEQELEMKHESRTLIALLCKHVDDIKLTGQREAILHHPCS